MVAAEGFIQQSNLGVSGRVIEGNVGFSIFIIPAGCLLPVPQNTINENLMCTDDGQTPLYWRSLFGFEDIPDC